MNKFKYLIICILPFVLCGCNAEYNLEIIDDQYKEELSVTADEDSNTSLIAYDTTIKEYNDYYLQKPIPVSIEASIFSEDNAKSKYVTYYEKEDLTKNNITGIKFKHTFDKSGYEESRIVNESYNRFLIGTIDGNVILSTGEVFKYFKEVPILDKVTVKIKTNHKVVKNNADEVKDGVYIWYITKDNFENKPIDFEFSKDEIIKSSDNEMTKAITVIMIVIGILLALVVLVTLFIYIKQKRANKL